MKFIFITVILFSFLFTSCDSMGQQSVILEDSQKILKEEGDAVVSEAQASREKAPVFQLADINGELVSLKSFQDEKGVILLFWTTWCPYCRKAMNDLNQQLSQLESSDIELLAVNVMESRTRIKLFLSSFPVKFKVLLDADGVVADSYNLVGVPTYVLIDKNGVVRFNNNYFPQKDYQRILFEE
jgi:peroxiredoxin